MNEIDQFELDILEHTGDVELAGTAGEAVRQSLEIAAESIAIVLGLPPNLVHTKLVGAWWNA